MLIIEKNLASLVNQEQICDESLVEQFCLKIKLSREIYELKRTTPDNTNVIKYPYASKKLLESIYEKKEIESGSICLKPGSNILSCSLDIYKIPKNCFGLVQTKGSLARLFVQITCNDGQVEPGFEGYITLEIVNLSPFEIEIPSGSEVGQLYLMKCSTTSETGYAGRYKNAAMNGPTIPIFD